MTDEPWEFRVKQSSARGSDEFYVRGEWLKGQLHTRDQPAELLVDGTVMRIERVFEKDQRKRVPGETVLLLSGMAVKQVPPGAVVRGPLT